jgi:hypothetical protein
LARDAGLGFDDVNTIVGHLNETRSGARQAKMVASVRDGMADRIQQTATTGATYPGKRAGSPRAKLGMATGQVLGLPEPQVFIDDFPDDVRAEMAKRIDEAIERLAAIREVLAT